MAGAYSTNVSGFDILDTLDFDANHSFLKVTGGIWTV